MSFLQGKTRRLAFVLSLLFGMMIFTIGNTAAAECKGKSQSSCESATDCSWVKGYEKKDGKKVSGYCRAKSGKATSSSKKSDTKKSSNSSDKKESDREKSSSSSDKKKSDKEKSSSSSDKKKTDKKKSEKEKSDKKSS